MNRYLCSDATCLSEKDIQDIIVAKNSMKRALEVIANKYKISSQWVYQIWKGVYSPIDPKEMVSCPLTDPPSDFKKIVSTNANLPMQKRWTSMRPQVALFPKIR